jgi:hypothetical protein
LGAGGAGAGGVGSGTATGGFGAGGGGCGISTGGSGPGGFGAIGFVGAGGVGGSGPGGFGAGGFTTGVAGVTGLGGAGRIALPVTRRSAGAVGESIESQAGAASQTATSSGNTARCGSRRDMESSWGKRRCVLPHRILN